MLVTPGLGLTLSFLLIDFELNLGTIVISLYVVD
jgi:hypothetical protein